MFDKISHIICFDTQTLSDILSNGKYQKLHLTFWFYLHENMENSQNLVQLETGSDY